MLQMAVSSARLWNRLGASQLQRSICGAAAEHAVEVTLGKRWSPPYTDVVHSKLVIIWGHNPVSTAPHFMPFLRQAQHNGCKLIVIDPRRTLTARGADWHVTPLPGSDGALALGIGHVLVNQGLHDETWLNEHTIGWPLLRRRLLEFPPERTAALTGLSVDDITRLAHLYATTRPGLIKIADGINRNRNGGQNVRAICALPALTGQYGVRGGGLAYSTSGYLQWDREAVNHWSECPPPGRTLNMNRLGAVLTGEAAHPPIMALYVFGANPATSSPNAGRIVEGLKREDLFTVVHELFLTDTADYADIVLPATSQLEHIDLHKAYGHTWLTYNQPAIAPLGEARSNWDVMRLLASAMGFTQSWLHAEADVVIEEVLAATARHNPALRGVSLERLRQENTVALAVDSSPPFADAVFPSPSGKVELYSQALADEGADPLPSYAGHSDDARCGESLDPRDALELITGASHHFVSSSLGNQAGLLKGEGPAFIEIHPDDAGPRGIRSGDVVQVENARGSCRLQAVITDAVRLGVVVSPKGRWSKMN